MARHFVCSPRPAALALLAALTTLAALPSGPSASAQASKGPSLHFAAPVTFDTGALPPDTPVNETRDLLPLAVAVGDFNHDGKRDVAAVHSNSVNAGVGPTTVAVLLGDGTGTLLPAPPLPQVVGLQPANVVVGDWNGDGRQDLAVVDFRANSVVVFLSNGDGAFQPQKVTLIPVDDPLTSGITVSYGMAAGHFDRDGRLDLAVSHSTPLRVTVSVLHGDGTGTFAAPAAPLETPALAARSLFPGLAAGDLDQDGDLDLAVAAGSRHDDDAVYVFLKQKDGDFGPASAPIIVGGSPFALTSGRFNQDAIPDLAVANAASADVSILLGRGDGTFSAGRTVKVGGYPFSIVADDLNADGITDLATANARGFSASILVGRGDGAFEFAHDFWAGDSPSGLAAGDFDGDDRTDLVVGQNRFEQVSLLLNNSPQPDDGVTIIRNRVYFRDPSSAPDVVDDGHKLDLYLPAGPAGFPVVFLVHGGDGFPGNTTSFSYLARTMARDGIGVAAITYRRKGFTTPIQDIVEDVVRAFAWTYKHIGEYGGNRDDLFVMGHSGGGRLAALLATDPALLAGIGLRHNAVIRGAIGVRGVYRTSNNSYSPLYNASADDPPFLLLNGTHIFEQSPLLDAQAFEAALKFWGVEAALVVVPGRDHFDIIGQAAQPGDPARTAILKFIANH